MKTEVQIAEAVNRTAAEKLIGINAKYVIAPIGRLFFGFKNKALKILDFDGIRFFEINAKLDGIIEVPENYVKPVLEGRETLLSLRDKLPGLIEQDAKAKAEAEAQAAREAEERAKKEEADKKAAEDKIRAEEEAKVRALAKSEAEAKLKAEQEAKAAKEGAAANEANKNQTPAGNGK